MKKTIRVMTMALIIALLTAMICGAVAERVAVSNGLRLNIKVREQKKEEKVEEPVEQTEEAVAVEEAAEQAEEAVTVEETAEQAEEAVAVEEPAEQAEEAVTVEEPAEQAEEAVAVEEAAEQAEEAVTVEETAEQVEEAVAVEKTAEQTVKPAPVEETAEQIEETVEEPAAEEEDEERSALVILSDNENEIALYAQPDTASDIVGMIPAGAMVGARKISGEWSYIAYDGMTGYVHTAGIALYNADAKEDEKVRTIRINSSLAGMTTVQEGTIVTLTAELSGFEDDTYTFKWFETQNDGTFVRLSGENGKSISFPLTQENFQHTWRVTVEYTSATDVE